MEGETTMAKPLATIPARDKITEFAPIKTPAHGRSSLVMPREIKSDVQAHRWMSSGKGKAHAFLVPAGDLPAGKVRALCPMSVDSIKLSDDKSADNRCKTCVKASAPDTRKYGKGLTEPMLPIVDKGATAAPTIGARDGGARIDGPALVKGPYMRPVQPTWTNPVTHEVEPAAARLDGSLRERSDRDPFMRPEIAPARPKRTNAQKRKFRAQQTAERQLKARLARQSSGKRD
jgi:hypothetical protein